MTPHVPRLVRFEIQNGPGIISFTFSESVDVMTFTPTSFLFMNTPNVGSAVFQLRLTGGTVLSMNGPVIDLLLRYEDINFIKAESMIFTSEINSYVSISSDAVSDTQGNPVIPISNTSGLQAGLFIRDNLPPSLLNFTLDLNSNTLILTFSETVRADSFIPESFTLLSSPTISPNSSYNLTGSLTVSPAVSATLNIGLTLVDTNALKQDLQLGTSVHTTYLIFGADSVSDTSSNNISALAQTNAVQAQAVIQDVTPPFLTSFGLEMSGDTPPVILVLSFSETVNASSLAVASITLQETVDGSMGQTFSLTSNSTVTPFNSFILRVVLGSNDLEMIRSLPPLGQFPNTTYVSFPRGTVQDMATQLSVAIPSSMGVEATFISADLIPPQLRDFTLDKNLDQLILTFSENVNSNTFRNDLVTLSDGSTESHVLLSRITFPGNSEIVTIPLNSVDQNIIKRSSSLGVNENSTFISFSSSVVQDIAGNDGLPVTLRMAARVVADVTSPVINRFDFDFDEMNITLVFNEPINPNSLDVRHIAIQNEQGAFPLLSYSLQQADTVSTLNFGTVLTFTLSARDRNAIQAIRGLATNSSNTFLTVNPEAVTDTGGNMVVRVSPSLALPVSSFQADTLQPQLEGFGLNLNSRLLRLSFSETVDTSTLNTTLLTLHNSDSSQSLMFLTSVPTTALTNVVEISISSNDFINLGSQGLCISGTNCFLDIQSSAIFDTLGLAVEESLDLPLSSDFTPDQTPPVLVQFTSIDIGTGVLNITFSEAVRISSLNTSAIVLQSFFEEPIQSYRLSENLLATSNGGSFVSIQLSAEDISVIKTQELLCTLRSNCYISLDDTAIEDVSNVANSPTEDGPPGFIVSLFDEDGISPVLQNFDFDLEAGNLTLYFSEPVDEFSLNVNGITLQSDQGNFNSVESYRLTSALVSTRDDMSTLILELSEHDINAIKRFSNLATSSESTYLSINSNTITDLATRPNSVRPTVAGLEVRVTSFMNDVSPPNLLSFTFDINLDHLVLTFDEPVNKSSLMFSRVVLYSTNSSNNINDFSVSLSSGSFLDSGRILSDVVTIILDTADIGQIKINSSIGSSQENTFLEILAGAVRDRAQIPIASSGRVQAETFVMDRSRPELLEYIFNIETGTLTLTFNDVVDISTFDPTAFVIQDMETFQRASFQLTRSTTTSSPNGYSITVNISPQDLLNIKLMPGLAKSLNSTYLTMQAFAIDDIAGVDVLAITDGKAQRASMYIADFAPPALNSVDLDLNNGQLVFNFDEAINVSSLDIRLVSISGSSILPSYAFTGFDLASTSLDATSLIVELNRDDLNELKVNPNFAQTINNSYITVQANFLSDLASNPFAVTEMQRVRTFVPDMSPPILESYSIDFNRGILVLNFSEAIRDFDATLFTLQPSINSSAVPNFRVQLSSSTFTMVDRDNFIINLSAENLNAINAIPQLANSRSSTHLTFEPLAVVDFSTNNITRVSDQNGIRAFAYVDDTTSPTFTGFILDLDSNTLSLTFNEVVRANSVSFPVITIQNSRFSSTQQYTLTDGTPPLADSTVLNITISLPDSAELQETDNLATSTLNTFISLNTTAVRDVSGNGGNFLTAVPPSNAIIASDLILDSSPPSLVSFELNLAEVLVSLTFSEYINVDSLLYSSFQIQSSDLPNAAAVPLTNSIISTNQTNSSVVDIDLGSLDFLALQRNPSIGTAISNTFAVIMSNALTDLTGNSYLIENPLRATNVIPDNVAPRLESFALNLGLRRLILTFSEPVNSNTVMLNSLSVHSTGTGTNQTSLTTNSTIIDVSFDSTEVSIALGAADNDLLLRRQTTTSINNTFISLVPNFIQDLTLNQIVAISPSSPIQAAGIQDDTLPPSLLQFSLNLNNGILRLDFSERVVLSTFNATAITLQNEEVVGLTTTMITLNGGTPTLVGTSQVELQLLNEDLNRIKLAPNFGTTVLNTFINLPSEVISDTSGTPLVPVVDNAQGIVPDTSPPSLNNFDLDLNTGTLTLHFSEYVRTAMFTVTSIQLQDASRNPQITVLFNDSTFSGNEIDDVQIVFSMQDLENINLAPLCIMASDCFLTIQAGVVEDLFMTAILGRPVNNPVVIRNFIPDTTSPRLERVLMISIETGELTLLFNEPMNIDSINITALMLHSEFSLSPRVSFINSTSDSINGREVHIIFLRD